MHPAQAVLGLPAFFYYEIEQTIMKSPLTIAAKSEWNISENRNLVIAGPCSVESEEQVMQTALGLKEANIDMLRGGIWKPRTRPNSFEGVGSVGLRWLKDAGKAIGVPVTCEVANAKHVYEALRNRIDVLWVGARTTVNPFAVQEIADALRGVDIPVLVKNPVNPDLPLWIGALERINQAGITRLGAIHRGFSTYGESIYRNRPHWEIPIELKSRIPDLPIIIDPSHISGRRDLIHPVSQRAYDLDFDGIMVETHITPDIALSDAKQQVTPDRFIEILKSLTLRLPTTTNEAFLDQLRDLRESIDGIDNQLLQMLGKRMEVAREIGKCKKQNNVTILQKDRWDGIVEDRLGFAKQEQLSSEFVISLFNAIHKESIRNQNTVMNG